MAPRGRLLDLERDDVLFFYGDYHQSDRASMAAHGFVFWPVFLFAALLLHLMAPFTHPAAVFGALYVAYCILRDQATQASSWLPLPLRHAAGRSRTLSPDYSGQGSTHASS